MAALRIEDIPLECMPIFLPIGGERLVEIVLRRLSGLQKKAEKERYHYFPPEILREVAEVFTSGAKKVDPDSGKTYTDFGWRIMARSDPGKTREQYYNSLMRHLIRWMCGEKIDPDSGKSHLTHVITNAIILRDIERLAHEHSDEVDDDSPGVGDSGSNDSRERQLRLRY